MKVWLDPKIWLKFLDLVKEGENCMDVNEEVTWAGRSSAIWLTLLTWPYLVYSVVSHDSPQIKDIGQ